MNENQEHDLQYTIQDQKGSKPPNNPYQDPNWPRKTQNEDPFYVTQVSRLILIKTKTMIHHNQEQD